MRDTRETTTPLWRQLKAAPRPVEDVAARARVDAFRLAAKEHAALPGLMGRRRVRALLLALADHSPYLWQLASAEPARLTRLLEAAPEQSMECALDALRANASGADEALVMGALRRAKQETALLVALADLGGVWSLEEVTRALSNAADALIEVAFGFALQIAGITSADESGLVVLALGKLGARELNYSSDVDLVVFFDPSRVSRDGDATTKCVRIVKRFARLLQERTGEGYALRVDLRLRPDPGSTHVAISFAAAYAYYETLGQNWERAAFIKARPVAGARDLGADFLTTLAPFIWRKYFDFAAIADIHAMKRQIHAVRGHGEVTVAGHDLKLGRGGIREIEFFVQTQQLIFGGRRPALRGARTIDMLELLCVDGWVTRAAVDDLSQAYRELRRLEHRLQMIADEQTQRLPTDDVDLHRFALFAGFDDYPSFARALVAHLRCVEKHYARLFEHAPGLGGKAGSLVFTGSDKDPATLDTLAALGFQDTGRAVDTVRGWHFGHRPAVRSARAREVITELIPGLLEAFSGSGDPDAALAAFDNALARMPAAVELFSLLRSNETLRGLFADILGAAPRLSGIAALRPHVLDAAIDPTIAQATASGASIEARIVLAADQAASIETFLDAMRDCAAEDLFVIAVRLLAGTIDAEAAGRAHSDLADAIVRTTLRRVEDEFRREYGDVEGSACVVVAMGKLGSREMTATSDLDLIVIYDFDSTRAQSSGAKSLHAVQYFTRLTQRLIAALTVATRRGRLYEVDMRLRPSGGKGPVATQWSSFVAYQTQEAETWEHMALCRARIIAGHPLLQGKVSEAITAILARKRQRAPLARAIGDMRRLVASEKGFAGSWDLKLAPGGILDVEFIAQYLILQHGSDLRGTAAETFAHAAGRGALNADAAARLVTAYRLFTSVSQMLRLMVDGPFDPGSAAQGVKRRLSQATGLPDFASLEGAIDEARADVRAVFADLIDR